MATDATIQAFGGAASRRAIVRDVAHRPFPLPPGPWIVAQRWEDVLFAHWPVPVPELRPLVPAPVAIDVHDGLAWIGLVARTTSHVSLHGLPVLPFARTSEIELRTYVHVGAHAGVFVLRHQGAGLALLGARLAHRARARAARSRVRARAGWIERESRADDGAEMTLRHHALGDPFLARPGTLDHFLAERYAVLAIGAHERVLEAGLHHRPWALRLGELDIERDSLTPSLGIAPLPRDAMLVHQADRQDVLLWRARRGGWGPEVA